MSGVVSAYIEAEVTKRVASQGIVVWLDKDGQYSAFVDGLIKRHAAGDLPFPVRGYFYSHRPARRGSESWRISPAAASKPAESNLWRVSPGRIIYEPIIASTCAWTRFRMPGTRLRWTACGWACR